MVDLRLDSVTVTILLLPVWSEKFPCSSIWGHVKWFQYLTAEPRTVTYGYSRLWVTQIWSWEVIQPGDLNLCLSQHWQSIQFLILFDISSPTGTFMTCCFSQQSFGCIKRGIAHSACTGFLLPHFAAQEGRKRPATSSKPTLSERIFPILPTCTNEWVFWAKTIKPRKMLREQRTWFQNEKGSSPSERGGTSCSPKRLWTERRKQSVGTMLVSNLGIWQNRRRGKIFNVAKSTCHYIKYTPERPNTLYYCKSSQAIRNRTVEFPKFKYFQLLINYYSLTHFLECRSVNIQ